MRNEHLDTRLERQFPWLTFQWKKRWRKTPDIFPILEQQLDGSYLFRVERVEAEKIGELIWVHTHVVSSKDSPEDNFTYTAWSAITAARHLKHLPINAAAYTGRGKSVYQYGGLSELQLLRVDDQLVREARRLFEEEHWAPKAMRYVVNLNTRRYKRTEETDLVVPV